MKHWHVVLLFLLLGGVLSVQLGAQEAQFGVAMPLTITGGLLDTGRAKTDDPSAATFTAGFRVLATPEAKLGSHWYLYSAVQAWSIPFFYDEAYSANRYIKGGVIQGYIGYTRSWHKTSLSFRVGKLSSAFGAFPLRYDDMVNPLLDQPLPYTYLMPWQSSGRYESYGSMPVTLYGLPAAEVDVSWRSLDARFQLTTSSPYNPQKAWASRQYPQWTAGGGYTIRQGFRVGASAFRGPWLGDNVTPDLPAGSSYSDFPATGLGVDAQWARGGWNANGEWDHFVFQYPSFQIAPASSFGYAELKRIISARWYAALRTNYQTNNLPAAGDWRSTTPVFANRQAYEVAVGFRPDRFQLLKVGYEWMEVQGGPKVPQNVFGVQFVTSIDSLSKAFK